LAFLGNFGEKAVRCCMPPPAVKEELAARGNCDEGKAVF
jgi:hypothetical protein